MEFICDFHIHSHFSVATSRDLIPEHLDFWAGLKGLQVVGTGDFTHPGWLSELKQKLEPAEDGLYRLKKEYRTDFRSPSPIPGSEVRFILTAEISNIYKKYGKVRKVHNLIFAPDFHTAEVIQNCLSEIGNITSDGRPILGLDSRDLLEIVLECSERCFLVPSHIWTPWFSALGAKSGFDSIEECYGELSTHIHAVETGLSSDPPMNWICSGLDRYTLISNSDAHSPQKLGREANLFDTEVSYECIINAMKTEHRRFLGTIEFFPQEGKYHYDGHRRCGVRMDPLESLQKGGVCPVCNKPLTQGVLGRAAQLADRHSPAERQNRAPFYSLIPLKEILSEITGVGPGSKKVQNLYSSLIQKAGPEVDILLRMPPEDLKRYGGEELAEGIRRMRAREVAIEQGFDGEYGKIRVFGPGKKEGLLSEENLFGLSGKVSTACKKIGFIDFDLRQYHKLKSSRAAKPPLPLFSSSRTEGSLFSGLNSEQQKAACHSRGPALIIAGPGTGKTRVFACMAAHLLYTGIPPSEIRAVTFTNRAAQEMKERLKTIQENTALLHQVDISTFHAAGMSILQHHLHKTGRREGFYILDENDRTQVLSHLLGEKQAAKITGPCITSIKQAADEEAPGNNSQTAENFRKYQEFLVKNNAFDFDDLVYLPVILFRHYPEVLNLYRKRYRWMLVDEFQDINNAQYKLIRMLMPHPCSNICAIGDPDQSIYGFRGASADFMKRFLHDYPEAAVYRLSRSYRCPAPVLKASRSLMEEGTGPTSSPGLQAKNGFSGSQGNNRAVFSPYCNHTIESGYMRSLKQGVKVKSVETISDGSEAEYVAKTIEEMMGGLRFFSMDSRITGGEEQSGIKSLSDFAVLCRLKQQMKVVEKAFEDHSIPYQTVCTTPFFKQEPVCLVIDMLKSCIYPDNVYLLHKLKNKGILHPERTPEGLISHCSSAREAAVMTTHRYFNQHYTKHPSLFNKLFDISQSFGSDLEGFLRFTETGGGGDTYLPDVENVALMTLHAAKGLEFRCVFVIGCEDGLIPCSLFTQSSCNMEEERRLLYVGMTRSSGFLVLTHAGKRFLFGREYRLKTSPFLDAIHQELLEHSCVDVKTTRRKDDSQLNLF
ncbi:MAG: UvrD-helicase domain-containing protein [Spirochaetota bacterium]